MIKTRQIRDHIPTMMTIEVSLPRLQRRSPPVHTADRDQMMRCLSKGVKRKEFLEAVEAETKKSGKERWQSMKDLNDKDSMWKAPAAAANKAANETFKSEQKNDDYKTFAAQRDALLQQRRFARQCLQDTPELATIQEEVAALSRRLCRERRAHWRRTTAARFEEFCQQWQTRRRRAPKEKGSSGVHKKQYKLDAESNLNKP